VTERDRKISDRLVELVQVIFAFVLAQGLADNRAALLHPMSHGVALLALVTVYVTTILSWVDWHTLMERQPYRVSMRREHETRRDRQLRSLEYGRLWFDLIIVALYAELLFLVEPLSDRPSGSLARFLFVYLALYVLYVVSGEFRRWAYGPWASLLKANLWFVGVFAALWAVYSLLRTTGCHLACGSSPGKWQNVVFLSATLVAVVGYRMWRQRLSARHHQKRLTGLTVGIDIDGVLADQVTEILDRANRRFAQTLVYDDVTEWRLPIGDTDIAALILDAMDDPDYVLNMPLHPGAVELVRSLYPKGPLKIITARPASARQPTAQWLDANRIANNGIVHAKEESKHLYALDVLVDDYLGNVLAFLQHSDGSAVVVDQPWNRDRAALAEFIASNRCVVVRNLSEVAAAIGRLALPAGKPAPTPVEGRQRRETPGC
jgi:5'(3')-deoxyribonucleotidase